MPYDVGPPHPYRRPVVVVLLAIAFGVLLLLGLNGWHFGGVPHTKDGGDGARMSTQ